VTTFAQPVVAIAPTSPIALTVAPDNPSQLSLTTGGSAGAVTSVNGQTGAVTITSLVNPMTTLGDSMYGGASGTVTRLAGNAAATRKFLRELGDGVNAAPPVWDTLVAGDIPALSYDALGAAAAAQAAAQTYTDTHAVLLTSLPLPIASGGTGQASAAAAIQALMAGGVTAPAYFAPKVFTLSQSGGLVAVDASLGNVAKLALTASGWTISNPTNPVDGDILRFRLAQDATGSRTVSWGTAYDFGSTGGTPNSAPTLSTGANKSDTIAFEYDAALTKWCYLGAPIPQGF